MKKFLITFLILLVLAITAFMFGWVQFSVPPGQYGVINSKTHGVDPVPVKSGEFRWVWFKLIPTNVKIAVFNLEHSNFPLNFNSSLPSGDTYASFVGLTNADFSWDLKGEISFSINPDKLVTTSSRQNLQNQDDLNAYMRSIAGDMEVLILRSLSSIGTDSDRLELLMSGNPDLQIEQEIITKYPEINDFSMVIHSAKYPDFILYRQLRLLYEDFLSKQRDSISSTFSRRAESHIEAQLQFRELEQYGELLTKYPILLEYLQIR